MGDGLFDRSYCSKLDNLDNVPIRFQFSSKPGPVRQRLLYCISGTAWFLTRVPAVLPSIKYSMVQAGAEPNPSKYNIAAMLARKHTHTHIHRSPQGLLAVAGWSLWDLRHALKDNEGGSELP